MKFLAAATILLPLVAAKWRENLNESEGIRELYPLDFLASDPSGTLDRCQGDCDKATQCRGDLVCYQKDKNEAVPVSLSRLFKYSPYGLVEAYFFVSLVKGMYRRDQRQFLFRLLCSSF